MASSGEFDGGRRFLAETGGIIAEEREKGKLRTCENRGDVQADRAICGRVAIRRPEGLAPQQQQMPRAAPKTRAGDVKPSVTVRACLATTPPRATQDLADQLTSPERQSSPQSHCKFDFAREGAMHLHAGVPCTFEDSFRCILVCLPLPDGRGSGGRQLRFPQHPPTTPK